MLIVIEIFINHKMSFYLHWSYIFFLFSVTFLYFYFNFSLLPFLLFDIKLLFYRFPNSCSIMEACFRIIK